MDEEITRVSRDTHRYVRRASGSWILEAYFHLNAMSRSYDRGMVSNRFLKSTHP
jgi:hypothetical protein